MLVEVLGTLDPKRHSQMDIIGGGGVMQTLDTINEKKKIAVPIREAVASGHTDCIVEDDSVNISYLGSTTRRGRVGRLCAQTLQTEPTQGVIVRLPDGNEVYAVWYEKGQCYIAIRKLTPLECFRLQGWNDTDFRKAEFVNSDNQLYRQAGNGVSVNVMYEVAKRLE